MAVLVRWKQSGMLVRDGIAESRAAGDEDEMDRFEARSRVLCGQVELADKTHGIPILTPEAITLEADEEVEGCEIFEESLADDDEESEWQS